MATAQAQSLPASDQEIALTRTYEAPRDLVFEAFTRPEHVAHWWGPRGFTITTHQMDVRPGGTWQLTMHGPDGRDYENFIAYLEVAPPERLVYEHRSPTGEASFRTTVTFSEEGAATRVLLNMRFPSAEARDYVVREVHAVEGGKQTLDRLAAYIVDLNRSRSTSQ